MRYLFGLCSIIISTAIALLIAECVVRAVHPAPKLFRFLVGAEDSAYQLSKDPVLGYELKPNFRSDHPDCHNTFDYTNANGQRDIERPLEKPPGARRILMLGDSVVAGHGLCDLNQSLSRRLEALLTGKQTEVLNFGVGGYCTLAEVELLKDKGLAYKPDEVLIVFVDNDYINSNGSIIGQIGTSRPAAAEWLFRRSDLFRLAALRYDLFGFSSDFDPMARLPKNAAAIGDDNINEGLTMLAKLGAENGFTSKLVLWPRFNDNGIHDPWPVGQVKDGEELPVETLAHKLGIPSCKLSDDFRKDFEERFEKKQRDGRRHTPRWSYTIGDGTHPSQLGAQVGAEAMLRECLEQ